MRSAPGLILLIGMTAAAVGDTALAQQVTTPTQITGSMGAQTGPDLSGLTNDLASNDVANSQTQAADESLVRIVRLSDVRSSTVKGEMVMLDRGIGQGFEQTIQNMPIVQGSKLETNTGYAEVEFEDSSTLRAAPDTMLGFPRLSRNAGGTNSTMNVAKGTVYVTLAGTRGNQFTLLAGKASVAVAPATHLRMATDATGSVTVAVFSGSAEVQTPSGPMTVRKKETLTLGAADETPFVTANVEAEPFDGWDKDADKYHQRYSNGNAFASSPYSYGVADLNYYGSFVNFGSGCGSMWQPYFVSAGWDPYGSGLWAWYPSYGYSWVSPYPWGWLPFHSGAWAYCPTGGWGWVPGRQWYGIRNISVPGHRPVYPPHIPTTPHPTLTMVNQHGFQVSRVNERVGELEFRNNSAGLGIPRGSMNKLGSISHEVEQHGFASRPVYVTAPMSGGRDGAHGHVSAQSGPVSLHGGTPHGSDARAYAPQDRGGAPSGGAANVSRGSSGAAGAGAGANHINSGGGGGVPSGGGGGGGHSGGGGGAPAGGSSSGGGSHH